ncbi:hypothetical protein [Streptosporangium roseum]|uniref:hypothetical protein n=1 Tax=Streptosporangium roseum TaxID=2001 RepID=UPI0009E0783B|nr:hypothetical protein [Streptosporangium roseum]
MTRKTTHEPVSLLPESARGRLLTVEEAAERLNTTVRFPRRVAAALRGRNSPSAADSMRASTCRVYGSAAGSPSHDSVVATYASLLEGS